jgi:hypothetical protein
MVDPLESKLNSAGNVQVDDARVAAALRSVVSDRAAMAKVPARRRTVSAVAAGLTFALLGTGAAVASQWGPWEYVPEPDLVIARGWSDVQGNFLGTCETHLAASSLGGDQRAAAQQFLSGLNVDALEPDAEQVAAGLVAVGRGDEIGNLVDGAKITDFDVTHTGELWADRGNAVILQNALQTTVFNKMSAEMIAIWPDLVNTLESTAETQCSPTSASTVTP